MSTDTNFSLVSDFLESSGAAEIHNHGTSLPVHLRNVWRILSGWDCPPHVCLAGLCHCVYNDLLAPDSEGRRRMIELIGDRAEKIVYRMFSTPLKVFERRLFLSARAPISAPNGPAGYSSAATPSPLDEELADIFTILAANDFSVLGHTSLSRRRLEGIRTFAADALHLLPISAQSDLARLYCLEQNEIPQNSSYVSIECTAPRAPTGTREMLLTRSVRDAYESAAEEHDHVRRRDSDDLAALERLERVLPKEALILDAGCGGAGPVGLRLARSYSTVGLDFAINQVALAKKRLPHVEGVCGELALLPFEAQVFDGICCYYTIDHIPRTRHSLVLSEFHRILKPGGWALLSLNSTDNPGRLDSEFLSRPVLFSHYDTEENLAMLEEEGFRLHWSQIIGDESSARLLVLVQRADLKEVCETATVGVRDRVQLERSIYPTYSSAHRALRQLYRDQWPVLVANSALDMSFVLCDSLAVRPDRDPMTDEVLLRAFGISRPQAADFYRIEEIFGSTVVTTLQHTWALIGFARWLERNQSRAAQPTVLHIDAHDDLQDPNVLATGNPRIYKSPVGNDEMNLLDPASVSRLIERGFIGIGGFLTPALHALGSCHFVNLYPPGVGGQEVQHCSLELTTEPLHYFGGVGERPVVRRSPLGPVDGQRIPAVFTNEPLAITPLPGNGPILLDIDMDFFCNHFDDSAVPPPRLLETGEVIDQINRLGEFLRNAVAGRKVELVNVAASPGFYPAALWEQTIPRVLDLCRSLLRPDLEGARTQP